MSFFSGMGKKEKIGLAIAGTIVFVAVFDRLVVTPTSVTFKKINSDIKTNERQLAQGLRNLNQKDDIERQYKKYLPYIKSDYSEGEIVAKLLEDIEGMGRSAGISIADIKPRPPKQSENFKYYIIEVEAEGRMEDLIGFLHQLAGSKQLYRASKIYINPKGREGGTVKASLLVTKIAVL